MSDSSIPFIANWESSRPFNDLGPVSKVDDLPNMLQGWRADSFLDGVRGGVEMQVGAWNTVQASLLTILAERTRAVARIVVPSGNFANYLGDVTRRPWSGTGFLVGPNLLLTNNHVLNSVEVAAEAMAQFDYQITTADLTDGAPDMNPSSVNYRLNPTRLFITSPVADLDFTFVWIEAEAAQNRGHVAMERGSFTIKPGESTYVIHHPDGRPKEASLDDTELLSINSTALVYAADTQGGSSGAPVFCPRGRLVGLHHAWRSVQAVKSKFPGLTGKLTDGATTNVVNEGIKLSAIALDLEMRANAGGSDAEAAGTVLRAFSGSDTMTGLFGGLGRRVSVEGTNAYERVVQIYQGNDQDLDIGAWNIEWLSSSYETPGKLRRVAAVITDLNLDIWALSEVSPDAVRALVKTLKDEFKQSYEFGFSEPEASGDKQSTAVIWRPNVVEGQREDWPEEIDNLLRSHSLDDIELEAVHGKVFNRYPGLFRFRTRGTATPLDFFLVPLHLKAKDEGSMRRQLASKLLAYAVERMVSHHGAEKDWILLGDVNAPLASGDFDGLTSKGFVPMSAEDEKAGAITYVKAPYASLIDNIFLSANMAATADANDFFIVAQDKVVDKYVQDISDHRPLALRLSLGTPQEGAHAETKDADATFADMLHAAGIMAARPTETWQTDRLNKAQFLKRNEALLRALIERVNIRLRAGYGRPERQLTQVDFWVLFYTEAGLTASGHVDPGFVHSAGEHGILPLPSNIHDWVGAQAPAWNRPMSLEDNLLNFSLYLGALKNKPAVPWRGGHLYASLFDGPGITDRIAAKLLAGIVHGYFVSGNYTSQPVPIDSILQGYRNVLPVDRIMAGTSYRHAGKPLMRNRQANIDAALDLMK